MFFQNMWYINSSSFEIILLCDSKELFVQRFLSVFKGTLIQIWKSANVLVFIWKQYVADFTFKHLLPFVFEICAREIYEKFVYTRSETIEYVKK